MECIKRVEEQMRCRTNDVLMRNRNCHKVSYVEHNKPICMIIQGCKIIIIFRPGRDSKTCVGTVRIPLQHPYVLNDAEFRDRYVPAFRGADPSGQKPPHNLYNILRSCCMQRMLRRIVYMRIRDICKLSSDKMGPINTTRVTGNYAATLRISCHAYSSFAFPGPLLA